MDPLLVTLCTTLGALLAMLGAAIQIGLDLGDRQSYMRTAEVLDPCGVKAAMERKLAMGYKCPDKLTWMPPDTSAWLQSKTPHMVGWISILFGATFLFIASLAPLAALAGGALGLGLVALVAIAAMILAILGGGIITAGNARTGRLRAEEEWQSKHPKEDLPDNRDQRFNRMLESWHDCLLSAR